MIQIKVNTKEAKDALLNLLYDNVTTFDVDEAKAEEFFKMAMAGRFLKAVSFEEPTINGQEEERVIEEPTTNEQEEERLIQEPTINEQEEGLIQEPTIEQPKKTAKRRTGLTKEIKNLFEMNIGRSMTRTDIRKELEGKEIDLKNVGGALTALVKCGYLEESTDHPKRYKKKEETPDLQKDVEEVLVEVQGDQKQNQITEPRVKGDVNCNDILKECISEKYKEIFDYIMCKHKFSVANARNKFKDKEDELIHIISALAEKEMITFDEATTDEYIVEQVAKIWYQIKKEGKPLTEGQICTSTKPEINSEHFPQNIRIGKAKGILTSSKGMYFTAF
ncbi:MAG: hypothetical protein J6A04_00095 [Clostridia bacterium]|nr:hypothetical protein [Clostridia bacterium]